MQEPERPPERAYVLPLYVQMRPLRSDEGHRIECLFDGRLRRQFSPGWNELEEHHTGWSDDEKDQNAIAEWYFCRHNELKWLPNRGIY